MYYMHCMTDLMSDLSIKQYYVDNCTVLGMLTVSISLCFKNKPLKTFPNNLSFLFIFEYKSLTKENT